MLNQLTVQIWSDVICPWCWIAEHRFKQVLAVNPKVSSVRVVHRSFRINQGLTPEPVEIMLAQKFGPRVNPAQVLRQMEYMASNEGLHYELDGTLAGDTIDAQRVLKLAGRHGLESRVLDAFYRGYFSEHANVFDREVLIVLAGNAGLDRSHVRTMFAKDEFFQEVESDQNEATRRGVSGVPYFLLGDSISISGAQPADIMASALARALDAQISSEPAAQTGMFCGTDGCTTHRARFRPALNRDRIR